MGHGLIRVSDTQSISTWISPLTTTMTKASTPQVSSESLPSSKVDNLDRCMTVDAFPQAVKTEGGILIENVHREGQDSLRLASDGHVSPDYDPYSAHQAC